MVLDVLSAFGANVWAAYNYNMGKFQFDAGQEQTSANMQTNLRLARWNLFREDVRDLFALTTTNMSTYMVVATLFLGFSISFVYVGLKDFPMHPGWLVLFFGNCLFASLVFGFYAVWLAMHGTVAAHSASVRVLTQVVRPPIPTEAVRFTQGGYEAAGPTAHLALPELNLASSVRDDAPRQRRRSPSPVSASPSASIATSSCRRPNGSFQSQSQQEEGEARLPETRKDGTDPVAIIRDLEGFGPGRSAELDQHIEIARELQLQCSCFDAYSRVCLSVAANHMILVCAYFVMGHLMVKLDAGRGVPIRCKALVWSSVVLCIIASRVTMKLDYFIDKRRMRIIKDCFVCGPLISCLAAHLWTDNTAPAYVTSSLAILAGIFHVAWTCLILWQARPQLGGNPPILPRGFRSVLLLDVFNSWTSESNGDDVAQTTSNRAAVDPEMVHQYQDLAACLQTLRSTCNQLPERSSTEKLDEMEKSMAFIHGVLFSEPARDTEELLDSPRDLWLRQSFGDGSGGISHGFIRSGTAEVMWEAPSGTIVTIKELSSQISALQRRLQVMMLDPKHYHCKHCKREFTLLDPRNNPCGCGRAVQHG
eukprot:CAMPEP_0169333188 /NCGR_PEP_ID=MMETSP1017-20121227/15123_1 /TAXON_ID=342587 /ORGANISM="Karlodinium micrum, Strain CCMP2283" /LENGTH=591 /DNA_ID=CAMNT_0009428387 /DNA_START=94 /DNA_END=1866 /DNA_ORIENTATION=-